jgi:heterodisulfide reductase subunit C
MTGDIRSRLLADPAGRDAPKCFTCGLCTGGCPVATLAPEYHPMQNLRDAFERGVLSPTIWWCATCYTCQDRCPLDVRMVEIIFLLQNLYVERHGRPDFIAPLVGQVEHTGYMGDISPALNRRRQQMGLPPLSTDIGDEIGKLLAALAPDEAAAAQEAVAPG